MVIHTASAVDFFVIIQDQLAMVEERMRIQADLHHPNLKVALDHLLSSGGKRVRPALALLTGGMLGGDPEALVILAASIELLHTATLVHDDLIDDSLLRRGISTLNARWNPAATVLTGDFLFSRAANLAAELESLRLQRMFANTLSTIVNGEITQLFAERADISRAQYDHRIYSKTGSLFELATTAAALLSHSSEEEIETARAFGNAIGMAFQIVDDLLDYTGEQSSVGKPVGSDLRQGIITLPAIYYLEAHPDDPLLQKLRNGQPVEDADADRLLSAIRESGSIELAARDAQAYVERGLEHLDRLPHNPQHTCLAELSRYIVKRKR